MSRLKTVYGTRQEYVLDCGCTFPFDANWHMVSSHHIGEEMFCKNHPTEMDGIPIEQVKRVDTGTQQRVEFSDGKGYTRHGSPFFYKLLDAMAEIHDKKSQDYASDDNPYGNYQFSGQLSKLFDNPDDAGFVARLGEKFYRLANLENSSKMPINETIEDTEIDICTITALWMASRLERRSKG